MDTGTVITAFVASAALGLVVGFERQTAPGWDDIAAGPRSFALYAIWGAGSALMGELYGGIGVAAMALGFGALIVTSYVIGAQASGDWGTTTEAAAFGTFLVGVLGWNGMWVPAVAVTVAITALLASKDPLHSLAGRFSPEDVRAVLQFAVITAVVLPLIPNDDFGPFEAINPRQIWTMVILVSGIGLVGYVTLRVLGTRGLALTGMAGGLVSSTAVSMGFSRMSKTRASLQPALIAGILGASVLMYPRVLVEVGIVERAVFRVLWGPLAILTAIVGGVAVYWWRKRDTDETSDTDLVVKNPLTLTTALQFGAIYGAVIFISKALIERASTSSLYVVGAVSGINDVDAISLSTANLVRDGLDPTTGAKVILLAVAVNTMVKAGIVASLGSKKLAKAVATALVPAAVAAVGMFFYL